MHGKALDYGLVCSVTRLSIVQETLEKALPPSHQAIAVCVSAAHLGQELEDTELAGWNDPYAVRSKFPQCMGIPHQADRFYAQEAFLLLL